MIDIDDVQRNFERVNQTGFSLNPVIKLPSLNDTKYNMNRWTEAEKRNGRKRATYAS